MDHSSAPSPPRSPSTITSSPTSTQLSASQNPAAAQLPHLPPLRLGSLHLNKCSFEDFLYLPTSIFGRYELEHGLLIARPMANTVHDRVIMMLLTIFSERFRGKNTTKRIFTAPVVVVHRKSSRTDQPQEQHSSDSSQSDPRIHLEPDVAIGVPLTAEQSARVSPRSQQVTFPVSNPPNLVVEVTSHNRERDLVEKKDYYAWARIVWYIIVDLDLPHRHTSTFHPCVHVGKLRNGSYKWRIYDPGQECQIPFFGKQYVDDLLNPIDAKLIAEKNVRKEKNTRTQLVQRASAAEDRTSAAEDRASAAETRKRKHKERARKYKEWARSHGAVVSDSSSAQSSPERDRSRNRARRY
ncbi:hypothetical protein BWQ96_09852 [Gracilariopsis chorda]|uniref:Putative restriction endonuclease domain-containing protein n=1 Tax=Gracilariopsis chorda TaxID=448386 RepID=A0A2V3IED9_9FLOR|nr:hypothetical protein BWQ96_09852 [Gracilariopsis chorda]|eukprot:PXF40437.1 hypothetical protein BWQ96_09852 [Gracilariopsis chorda]